MRTVLTAILFAIFVYTPLAAQEFSGTLQQIKKSGAIRIGFRQSLPPLSFLAKNNIPEGYTIDICHHIAAEVESKLNIKISVEYVPVDADHRFNALIDNEIDLLCGATTKTLERQEKVDFTELTFVTGASFLTLRGSGLENNFAGKKIGVVEGTTTATALEALFKDADIKADIILLTATEKGITEVKEGKLDAFAADQVVLIGQIMTAENPSDYTVLPDLFSYEPFAIALRRNDADFRLVADRAIAELYRSEKILTIYDKWFSEFSKKRPTAIEAMIQLLATPEK